jgi:hypothetical protein
MDFLIPKGSVPSYSNSFSKLRFESPVCPNFASSLSFGCGGFAVPDSFQRITSKLSMS